jgi:hypothetical protein
MSAFPLKADMPPHPGDVGFVPKAAIDRIYVSGLFQIADFIFPKRRKNAG